MDRRSYAVSDTAHSLGRQKTSTSSHTAAPGSSFHESLPRGGKVLDVARTARSRCDCVDALTRQPFFFTYCTAVPCCTLSRPRSRFGGQSTWSLCGLSPKRLSQCALKDKKETIKNTTLSRQNKEKKFPFHSLHERVHGDRGLFRPALQTYTAGVKKTRG